MTVVDCVAFAPHGRIDMQAWGCDAVVFSYYKVSEAKTFEGIESLTHATLDPQLFGPHLSALALAPSSPLSSLDLASLGHYFHPKTPAYKLAPGGAPYELAASLSAIAEYLRELGGGKDHSKAFARIEKHEHALSERLLAFLTSDEARGKGVRVVGPEQATGREPTISFVVVEETQGGMWKKRLQCKDIVERVDKDGKVSLEREGRSDRRTLTIGTRRLASNTVTSTQRGSCLAYRWRKAATRSSLIPKRASSVRQCLIWSQGNHGNLNRMLMAS